MATLRTLDSESHGAENKSTEQKLQTYGLLDTCLTCNWKYTTKWIAEAKGKRLNQMDYARNVRKEQELHFLPRIIDSEKKNGKEVSVVGVASKMNTFTISFGHKGNLNEEKKKSTFHQGKSQNTLKSIRISPARTDKSLNTLKSCFLLFLSEIQILPFHWLLKKISWISKGICCIPDFFIPTPLIWSLYFLSPNISDILSPSHHPFSFLPQQLGIPAKEENT